MSLPPELIDRILKSLRDDPKSLMVASLISKAWTTWSHAYLFESVHLKPANLQHWLKSTSQDVDALASHTRTLTLEEYRLLPWINPQYLDLPLSNLTSFRDVRSLSLIHWNATLFNGASPEPYFGHFGKSLRALNLRFCMLEPVILFNFLSLLPNVQDLEIAYLFPYSAALDTIPDVPKVTPSFCGTLLLADLASGHLILKALAALPLRFTAISIRGCTFHEPDVYQMLLTSCRETLVTLRFEKSYRGVLGVCRGSSNVSSCFYTSRSAGSRRLVSFLRPARGVPRAPSQHQKTPPIPYGRLVVDNLSKTSKDILIVYGPYRRGRFRLGRFKLRGRLGW
jgi:hypothetical protein